jgi:RNA polymerase sigma-70 factor (ECF subfamily)
MPPDDAQAATEASARTVAREVADAAVTRVAREESGRVIALLAHRFGDVDLADEAVHEALITALEVWPAQGVPEKPAAWLFSVARNGAIDRMRRAASARRRILAAAPELHARGFVTPDPALAFDEDTGAGEEQDMIVDPGSVHDEHLRLVLLCCHPALDRDTQVALTLRLVGGLSTPEIAAAFLIPETTLAQRIVRAKRKIRDARIPLSLPADIDERIEAVLTVLYLIFNEAYLSRGTADAVVRVDLAAEAIRVTRVVQSLLPDAAEVQGLLALELFQHSRTWARTDAHGDLVLLEEQDRSSWDRAQIESANEIVAAALTRMDPGPFQVQALIAAHHANARTAAETDWPGIARLYGQLEAMTGSPIVSLNRAVAVAMADGPRAGLDLIDGLDRRDVSGGSPRLADYHLLHAARGELLLRADEPAAAVLAFERACALARNPAEKRHLERRLREARTR